MTDTGKERFAVTGLFRLFITVYHVIQHLTQIAGEYR